MAPGSRPSLVGRRFLSVTGSSPPKLKNLYDWDWRAGVIRSSSSSDCKDEDLQLLLEYDELSWKQRDWFSVYSSNSVSNFPASEEKKKDSEKEKKRKRRKTETDSEDEEKEDFQIFLVEEKLVVAHRPNYQGSSSTTGTLYPALTFKVLVDKPELFKSKKLPVEFLSDNKLVFQEYSHLKTVTEWDPSIPGLAVCTRSESEVRKWCEDVAAQRILLTTPSVLVGERLSVYRVEGTTQWYSAFIIGINQETGEFTVTDDTVLEEHLEDPNLVQMRILGEGVVQSILRGESVSTAPRRSRASAYRDRLPPPSKTDKQDADLLGPRIRNRRSSSATHSGKLKPRSKRRVSSESPQKTKPSSDKKLDRGQRRKSSLKSSPEETKPDSLSSVGNSKEPGTKSLDTDLNCDTDAKSPPSLPIRLPTKCKPKTDSDSDSDSRSSKSSTSASGKVSKVLKKTFKGKAIAIVKPFSNAVTENKKSPPNEKQKQDLEARLNLYEFGSDEDRESGQRTKLESDKGSNTTTDKESVEVTANLVTLSNSSSSPISSIKGVKQLKSGKHLASSRRLKSSPEQLKSVRVRVEKLNKGDKSRNNLGKNKSSRQKEKEKRTNSAKRSSESENQSEENSPDKVQKKVDSESEVVETTKNCDIQGSSSECKEEPSAESLTKANEDLKPIPVKSEPTTTSETQSSGNFKSEAATPGPSLCKDEKITEIVKSELFSQPSPSLNKESASAAVKLKPENISDRNEDSASLRNRMEDDTRSDSGVSTLRSDGARSSGDERSGSRSSALSDERAGSRPSSEPDIKIVGSVPGHFRQDYRHVPRVSGSDPRAAMADPRAAHAAFSGASQLSSAAQLLSAAAHYHPSLQTPQHMMPQASAAAILQYQQLATAAALAGISPDALLKQQYPGLAGIPSHLLTAGAPHPATELLLERERQIAQERDRALRERREQEQRERDRLDKERMERERREREERDRKEREKARMEMQKERERQATMDDVDRHFQLSMELAKKVNIDNCNSLTNSRR